MPFPFFQTRCNDNHQHLNLAQNPPRFVFLAPGLSGKSVVSASFSPYCGNGCVRDADCAWPKRPWFLCGGAAVVPAAWWRAATTRRTITRNVARLSVCNQRSPNKSLTGRGQRQCALHPLSDKKGKPTSKGFFNINHLPRTRLHKATAPTSRILQPLPTANHPAILQITLVPRHELDRLHTACILPEVAFHIYHLHEVVEGLEGGGSRDVVDEEKGVGFEIRGGPEAAVFFLARRVGEGEEVGLAVYGASGGIGVLWEVRSEMGSVGLSRCGYLSWGHICREDAVKFYCMVE